MSSLPLLLRYVEPPWKRGQKLIEVRSGETDSRYGKEPHKRTLSELLEMGFVVIDKHVGPTSHTITAEVRRILGVNEAGHGGTLELTGRSCRLRSPAYIIREGY